MANADALRFLPEVATDLCEAIEWYRAISPELAVRFRRAIDAGFDQIANHPDLHPFAIDDVRFFRVRRFPYLILYRALGEVVVVLGVLHGASDPSKWRSRESS